MIEKTVGRSVAGGEKKVNPPELPVRFAFENVEADDQGGHVQHQASVALSELQQ